MYYYQFICESVKSYYFAYSKCKTYKTGQIINSITHNIICNIPYVIYHAVMEREVNTHTAYFLQIVLVLEVIIPKCSGFINGMVKMQDGSFHNFPKLEYTLCTKKC